MASDWEKFREEILDSADVQSCKKPPLPPCGEDQNYLFVSYAHADYKGVYCDLLRFLENGVRFWYDEGIDLGPVHWSEAAREKMQDARCVGVIFYVSAHAFMSPSVMQEITWLHEMREAGQEKNYFTIYLGTSSIDRLLYEDLPAMYSYDERKAKGLDGKKMSFLFEFFEGTGLSRSAEPESETHLPKLLEQIGKQFNVMETNTVAKEFFFGEHKGNIRDGYAEVTYRDGVVYKGFFKDYQREGEGKLYNAQGELLYEGSWAHGKTNGFGKRYYLSETDQRETYEGELKDGVFQGKGKLTWKNGTFYEGGFVNGKREGYGIRTFKEPLERYEGFWKEDAFEGQGLLLRTNGKKTEGIWKASLLEDGEGYVTYKDGSVFEGTLRGGKRVGFGKITFSEKDKQKDYEGDWAEDQRCGRGVLHFKDGAVYEGEFKDNKFHGIGVYTYPESSSCLRYEGSWEKDQMEGFGKLIFAEKDNRKDYEGEWKEGKRCGRGVMHFKDGAVYEGEWKDNCFHGTGVYTYPESSSCVRYEGSWEKDKKEGHGLFTFRNGASYEGEFHLGKKEGWGIYRYAPENSCDRYEGDFAKDGRSGQGILYYRNGKTWEGIFENDGLLDGHGWTIFGEDNYEGTIKNGKREGRGVLYYANGRRYEGEFHEGKLCGKGIYWISEEEYYEGDFAEGTYNGTGVFHYAPDDRNGRICYEGEWKDGNRHGQGKETRRSGKQIQVFEGTWVDGKMTGKGREIHLTDPYGKEYDEPKIIYEGMFVKGKKEGEGTLTTDYGTFEGIFAKGERHKGTFRDLEGHTLTGTWENGRFMEGYGYVWKPFVRGSFHSGIDSPEGWSYVGEWKGGMMNGEGTLTYRDGKNLTGIWKDNAFWEGKGCLRCKIYRKNKGMVSQVYEGEFAEGCYQGSGRLTLSDGTVIEGTFSQGKAHGQCRIRHQDGAAFEGLMLDGVAEGFGVQTQANGDVYEGYFAKGKRCGQGKLTRKNGYVFEGRFEDGAFAEGELRGVNASGGGCVKLSDAAKVENEALRAAGVTEVWEGADAETGASCLVWVLRDGQGLWQPDLSLEQILDRTVWGVLRLPNGTIYVGDFVGPTIHGKGTLSFARGDRYEGLWKGSAAEGSGTLYYADGQTRSGETEEGSWDFDGDFTFEGAWIGEETLCGWGKRTFSDGTVQEGIFRDGKFLYPYSKEESAEKA